MIRPRLFMEAPAGLAALSLRLHGGPDCRPPISRMGNKAGYAQVILAALGLQSGQGADAYLWAEADLDVAALLRCYPDAAMLRRVAEIIRGWAGEEPRALWTRLREERKARGVVAGAEGTAEWLYIQRRTIEPGGYFNPPFKLRTETRTGGEVEYAADGPADACHRLAEYATLADGAFRQGDPESGYRDDVRQAERGGRDAPRHVSERLGERFEGMAREVAGYGILAQWAFRRGEPESGYNAGLLTDRHPTPTGGNGAKARTCNQEAGLWEPAACAAGWPPVAVLTRIPEPAEVADMLGTPGDLSGVVVYMDPDYVGTTGYAHTFPRADVVRFALGYAALGATVAVSEAVPVEELVAAGWHAIDITGGRKGQRRTFARVATEAVTMNREPAHRVAEQAGLFVLGAA